jgi:Xaa-Pro aminopeptidase
VPDPREERQARLRARLAADGLTGLLVTHLPNVRYLTGFTGSAGTLLVLSDQTILFTDFRYESQAPREVDEAARVETVPADTWASVVAHAGPSRGEGWGFEAEHVPVATARELAEKGLRALTPTKGVVETLRQQKTRGEADAIRAAAQLCGEAWVAARHAIRPGAAEREVAAELEAELRRRGSEWHPFPTIVASGPRSALPHAGTSDRTIERNDLVLLDFGAKVDGYCADITRVVVAGRADDRQRAIHELVREAQHQALAGLKAGLTGQQGDALARGLLEARGYGEAFGHSLGHGLGLEVHEGPRLSKSSEEPLPLNAVVTVEPGIYLPGWGGVRLEDDVMLTEDGVELLSDGEIELVEV